MDMQNVSNLQIPEGAVRTIHDKDNRLIWGGLGYDTKYGGDISQQTQSGKNLFKAVSRAEHYGIVTTVNTNNSISVSGLSTSTGINLTASFYLPTPVPAGSTLTLSFAEPAPCIIRAYCGGWVQVPRGSTSASATVASSGTYVYLAAVVTNNTQYDFNVDNIQLEIGSSPTAFEPFIGATPAPSPFYPEDISFVMGEQNVSVFDGVMSENYKIDTPVSLYKINSYQDYIYKSGDDWYVHNEIAKSNLGDLNWSYSDTAISNKYRMFTSGLSGQYVAPANNATVPDFKSNYFTAINANNNYNNYIGIASNPGGTAIYAYHSDYTSTSSPSSFKTWLSDNNVVLYYVLKTPTDTRITDSTLISQLEAVNYWLTRYGYSSTVSGNLPIVINKTALS